VKMTINKWQKKVFVSGCYDLLHSGHVEFFQQASQYGDLYMGIGVIDFLPTLDKVKPDVFVVNAEGGSVYHLAGTDL
jgi:cytidyltransferase-like protein